MIADQLSLRPLWRATGPDRSQHRGVMSHHDSSLRRIHRGVRDDCSQPRRAESIPRQASRHITALLAKSSLRAAGLDAELAG